MIYEPHCRLLKTQLVVWILKAAFFQQVKQTRRISSDICQKQSSVQETMKDDIE